MGVCWGEGGNLGEESEWVCWGEEEGSGRGEMGPRAAAALSLDMSTLPTVNDRCIRTPSSSCDAFCSDETVRGVGSMLSIVTTPRTPSIQVNQKFFDF